jgi:hypothetical protein
MKLGKWVKRKIKPDEVAREIYHENPAGIRQFLIRKWVVDRKGRINAELLAFMHACVDEADRLSDTMVDRNRKGSDHEKNGEIEAAIEEYELNISEWFDGDHPYERLRVIYNRRKQYEDALRVCKAFICMSLRMQELGSPRVDLEPKRNHFQDWIHRLEARLMD